MHRYSFRLTMTILVVGVLALGQNTAMNEPAGASHVRGNDAARNKDTYAVNISGETPVITLDGFCDTTSVIGEREKPCRTVVTRSEFEELAEAAGSDELAAKAQLAAAYVRFSLLAREAQKRGMDKDPQFQKKLELSRIQILSQVLVRELQVKSEQFSADDLQKFFRENPSQFEQVELLRIHIPDAKYVTQPNQVQNPLPESAPEMKALAQKMYVRARAGEDFVLLQKEALVASGLDEEPTVDLGKTTRSHLRASHRFIFDLKQGEISTPIHEREEGYYVYKVLSKEAPSFESVKSEVGAALQKQRMDAWIKNIMSSAGPKLNDQYFGPESAKTFQ